ncbi:MAG: cytochrome P450 [Sandaracinus sp.]
MPLTLSGPRRPALAQMLHYAFRPEEAVQRNIVRYGSTHWIKSFAGPVLATASPDHARRIFAADPDTFATFAAVSLSGVLGERSVLVTHGPEHRRQRKLLTPPLHGPRLRAFGEQMRAIALDHVARLRESQTLRAHDLTTEFTLDVILRTVFGVESGSELRAILLGMLEGFSPLAVFAPMLQRPWFPPFRKYLAAREAFYASLDRLIAERRRAGTSRGDVLSLLLEARYDDGAPMDETEIRQQLLTLLIAGHETTAISLAWVLDYVLRRPEVLTRLIDEVRGQTDPDAIAKLPYLGAVIDETMRISPVVTDAPRLTRVPFELEPGLVIPAGTPVIVLIEGIHRDPSIYPDPGRFRPERFLERRPSPTEFLPFGGGHRRCLGAAFSEHEARIFLATLLSRAELETVSPTPSARVRRNVTMGPADGVPLRVRGLR